MKCQRFLRLIGCFSLLLMLWPLTGHALDSAVIDACNALLTGRASPTQRALVVYHRKELNRMALRGEISDAVYQAAQKQFNDVNAVEIQKAVRSAGLKARLQEASGGRSNPGTDTDVLVESARSGKKITLEQIETIEKAHQEGMHKYFKDHDIKVPDGKIDTDTDFMPRRSSVTDAEFRRINEHINRNGGTAYERPGAAEVEFQKRLSKNDPASQFALRDTAEYVSEMRRLTNSKIELADRWEAEAARLATSDPALAEALRTDAQVARSHGAKYLQRLDEVTNLVAEQNGLPVLERTQAITGDSLDSAIKNIRDKGRGVETAGDADMIGELGELGIGRGLRGYAETLSRLAASKPSRMAEIQAMIAEQAETLSPGMREALILRSVEAYQNAGGTPLGSRAFGRNLIRMLLDPSLRPRGAGIKLPESVAAGGRVAGTVGGALTVAAIYLEFQACVDSGKPEAQCQRELQQTLKTIAVVGGGIFAGNYALVAMGVVTESTVAAVGSVFAIAMVPLALYAAYAAGTHWAEAPLTKAQEILRNQEKEQLLRFARLASQVQAEIAALPGIRAQAAALCQQIVNRGKGAVKLAQASEDLARQWSSAQGEAPGGDTCQTQREIVQKLTELAKQTRSNEDKAIQGLDAAVALGEKCSGRQDAEKIRQLVEAAKTIGAQMLADAAQARGRNNRLAGTDVGGAKRRLAAADDFRERLVASNEHLASQSREIQLLQDDMNALFATYAERRSAVVGRVESLGKILPKQAPSPLYEPEYFDANAREAKLHNTLEPMPETLSCASGAFDPGRAITLRLQAENRLNALDEGHRALRDQGDQAASCPGGGRQDKLVEDMEASANWVLAAVEMNSPLLKKADACQDKSRPATAIAKPAADSPGDTNEADIFQNPVFLFRLWEKDPKQATFMFYGKPDGKDGAFRFADGSGGYYWRQGENLGQYKDARSVCAVLRGYGVYFAEFNLGWAPHVRCSKEGSVQKPVKADSGATPSPAANAVVGANGNVLVRAPDGSTRPLQNAGAIPYGATVETGNASSASFTFPSGTGIVLGPNSRVEIVAPTPGTSKQIVRLLQGDVEVNRPQGLAGADNVFIETRDATGVATGTRYKVSISPRGTTFQVSEGTVRVTGDSLVRTDAGFNVPGKPSPAKELQLQAGQYAVAFNIRMAAVPQPTPPEVALPAASPLTRADPWNDSQVQQLIDEWLRSATPTIAAGRSGQYSYSEWGQIKGPGITIAGAPDHPAGWSRYQSMWAVRTKFDSLNLCTLGEFIERRITNKGMAGCNKATAKPAAVPSWLPPTSSAAPKPADNRANEALTLARTEVTRMEAESATAAAAPPPKKTEANADCPSWSPYCRKAAEAGSAAAKSTGLLERIEAIPGSDWVGNKPSLGRDGRLVFALVAEVQDARINTCHSGAQRKGWIVVGFSSRNTLEQARYASPPPFPLVLGYRARDTIYAIHTAAGRSDVPIPFATAYLLDPSGRVIRNGACEELVGIHGGASEGKK